jgi:hypothetical protein
MSQIREEFGFTKGRIIVRGKLVTRGKAKRADHVLYFKPIFRLRSSRPRTIRIHLAVIPFPRAESVYPRRENGTVLLRSSLPESKLGGQRKPER